LVLAMAFAWGRRHVAHLYPSRDPAHHQTRVNHVCLVPRWDPEAALRQQARELLQTVHPQPRETRDRSLDESKQAQRGQALDAGPKRQDPGLDASIRGPQSGCGLLVLRPHVIPQGIRLAVTKEPGPAVGWPFRQTTAMAAQLLRAWPPPAGVTVMVWCEASSVGRTVVQACRAQGCHVAATRTSHRRLCTPGWQLNAGRDGRTLWRRRRSAPLVFAQPPGHIRSRCVDAGWLAVSHRGPLHGVCSRHGTARQMLGRVTEAPALSAAGRSRADETRWAVEPFFTASPQLRGLGPYQHRPNGAAVTPLQLVCFADALLTHLRLERDGAHGQSPRKKAADLSTAAAQDQLRGWRWEALITYVRENRHGQPVIEELERLRVA